jgi:hypothetical protein
MVILAEELSSVDLVGWRFPRRKSAAGQRQALFTRRETELKLSQYRIQRSQLNLSPPAQRITQMRALAVREKHQMHVTHSLVSPLGSFLRMRSKTPNGPRSFVIKWLTRKVAREPRINMSQFVGFTLLLR